MESWFFFKGLARILHPKESRIPNYVKIEEKALSLPLLLLQASPLSIPCSCQPYHYPFIAKCTLHQAEELVARVFFQAPRHHGKCSFHDSWSPGMSGTIRTTIPMILLPWNLHAVPALCIMNTPTLASTIIITTGCIWGWKGKGPAWMEKSSSDHYKWNPHIWDVLRSNIYPNGGRGCKLMELISECSRSESCWHPLIDIICWTPMFSYLNIIF